ncbi:MAG TPA: transcriptional regulator GcvA [Candidatus Cybelea sp.]|nr:transcriptional regulator GcvA [Candidatus Cybelea sp.]
MRTRTQRLPSLNGLKVFWAAARHGSFVKAAGELHVTASAVSLQVRQLEDELGTKLFERTARGLALTASGQRVLPDVASAFERLQQSFAAFNDADQVGSTLTVSAAPSFATKWLLPRLNRFLAAHPEIEVSLKATVELADFERSEADLGIRYGRGNYPGLVTELLMREMMFPICSPDLLAGKAAGRSTAEFLNAATLLHDDSATQSDALPGWKMWLRAAGIETVDWRKGPHFDQSAFAIEAAASGLGVALAPAVLVEDDIASGRLVRLDGAELREPFSYYLVYPSDRSERSAVKSFRQWLFAELNLERPH